MFNKVARSLGMTISTSTTDMTTSKITLRCKLVVDGSIVRQVMKCNYQGVEIFSFGEIETEVRTEVVKAITTAAQLEDTIFRNKQNRQKIRIYKTNSRPILKYTA